LAVVESLFDALAPADRATVAARVAADVTGIDLAPEVRTRTERALRLRAVRELIGLPRLELTPS
jgi:hypothetical protein